MQANDISAADLGDGFKLSFQEARNGSVVRAIVKNPDGVVIVTGLQTARETASKSRFDAVAKFLEFRKKKADQEAYEKAEAAYADLGDDEDEDEEDEDEEFL